MSSNRTPARTVRRQRGAAAVMFIVMAIMLLGMGGFAIDMSRAFVMRNELQNAADAAALAGAGALYRESYVPDWADARTAAQTAVVRNKSENKDLALGLVEVGWWNLDAVINPVSPSLPVVLGEIPAPTPTASYGAMVKVTVTKGGGANGGPMAMTLGRLLGVSDIPVSATAYAAVAKPPGTVNENFLIPFTIPTCFFEPGMLPDLWNSSTNKPVLPPVPFVIASGATAGHQNQCSPSCQCGQWTTFGEDDNSVPGVEDLIMNGNPDPVSFGDEINISPGTKASLYTDVETYLAGKEVAVAIIDQDSMMASAGTKATVEGFACIKILGAKKGGGSPSTTCRTWDGKPFEHGVEDNKCVIAQFSEAPCTVSGSGSSTSSTTILPPRLVY